ncbi:MAG TPA: BON domain-containing protein [Burkholderiales bacterium]|nr:BON domain-containing protein [Burkholderiales bacterium]
MQRHVKSKVALATVAAGMLLVAGCGQHDSNSTVGQKMDRATENMASTANNATAKVETAADDTAITAKVKSALIAEPNLKSTDINVETKDATVTLSGTVATSELRDRAKQIASSTTGVKNVVDNLVVKA